jgi:hypothetical protein
VGGVRAVLVGLAAAGFLGGCSSSLAPAKSDAGRDATSSVDRPTPDRPIDATGGADRHDAAADRQDGGGCAPLDRSMWPVGQSPATWAEVVAYPGCAEQPDHQKVRVDCGGYHTVTQFGADFNVTSTYDATTGQLVAVSSNSNGGYECWGPPGGITPSCTNPITTTVCASDGGVSAALDGGNCLSTGSPPFFSWNDPCPGDGGTPCYANCSVFANSKYVGCVSETSVGTRCYASCSECP